MIVFTIVHPKDQLKSEDVDWLKLETMKGSGQSSVAGELANPLSRRRSIQNRGRENSYRLILVTFRKCLDLRFKISPANNEQSVVQ